MVEGEQAIEQQVYVDIDGDGRADAISRGEKGLSVMRNNGHGFDKAEIWEVDISGIEKEENQTVSTSINRFLGAGGGGGVLLSLPPQATTPRATMIESERLVSFTV